MNNGKIPIQERTENFAIRVIKAYSYIEENNSLNDAIMILSKQFIRSGTSIGAIISLTKY